MPKLYLNLENPSIELKINSDQDGLESGDLEHCRFISIKGTPNISGTCRNTGVEFKKGGVEISLPSHVSISVRDCGEESNILGEVSYLERFSDSELDIEEPDQFCVEVSYPYEQFEKLWKLIGVTSHNISVSVAFRSPKSDISGYLAIFELEDSSEWPVDSIYFTNKVQ
jgi:hypothetical protein